MRCREGLASRERIARGFVELAELFLKAILGEHRASELLHELVEGHELLGAIDGNQLRDGVAVDGDPQLLARFDATQQVGCVVAKLALWYLCRHWATL
jgi:hypothetical protein